MKYAFTPNPDKIKQIAGIQASLNPVEIATPKNAKEEKEHWLIAAKIGNYPNPSFVYDEERLRTVSGYSTLLSTARYQIETGMIPENEIDRIIKKILLSRFDNDSLATTELASSILLHDDLTSCALNHQIYGHPSNSQVIRAYSIVKQDAPVIARQSRFTKKDQKKLEKMTFIDEQIAYWFEEAIALYGFKGWTVEVGNQYTAIDVRDKSSAGKPVVGIPTGRKVNGLKLLELIGHEIECHLRGSENCKALVMQIIGENSPLLPFVPILAKSDNELFYEGVAKVSDVSINGNAGMPKPYATIACDCARRGSSFSETAKFIERCRLEMGEKDEDARKGAWTTTYRIMRGCTNTAVGGYNFSKDYIYMSGYDLACQINENLHNFSSMTIDELNALQAVLLNLVPAYPHLDAVGWVKGRLLSE